MKKTNLLMPILGVGALAGTIVPYAVSCGTNTPDDPTEAPEMIITKSADTVLSDGQITITVDSTTKGKLKLHLLNWTMMIFLQLSVATK